ncbi:MAG: hypothetical protein ACKOYK_03850 [Cyanobium sp.]
MPGVGPPNPLRRRRRLELLRSLEQPHPDTLETAALGFQSWSEALPVADAHLLDPAAGVPMR